MAMGPKARKVEEAKFGEKISINFTNIDETRESQ